MAGGVIEGCFSCIAEMLAEIIFAFLASLILRALLAMGFKRSTINACGNALGILFGITIFLAGLGVCVAVLVIFILRGTIQSSTSIWYGGPSRSLFVVKNYCPNQPSSHNGDCYVSLLDLVSLSVDSKTAFPITVRFLENQATKPGAIRRILFEPGNRDNQLSTLSRGPGSTAIFELPLLNAGSIVTVKYNISANVTLPNELNLQLYVVAREHLSSFRYYTQRGQDPKYFLSVQNVTTFPTGQIDIALSKADSYAFAFLVKAGQVYGGTVRLDTRIQYLEHNPATNRIISECTLHNYLDSCVRPADSAFAFMAQFPIENASSLQIPFDTATVNQEWKGPPESKYLVLIVVVSSILLGFGGVSLVLVFYAVLKGSKKRVSRAVVKHDKSTVPTGGDSSLENQLSSLSVPLHQSSDFEGRSDSPQFVPYSVHQQRRSLPQDFKHEYSMQLGESPYYATYTPPMYQPTHQRYSSASGVYPSYAPAQPTQQQEETQPKQDHVNKMQP